MRTIAITAVHPEVDITDSLEKFSRNDQTKFVVFSPEEKNFGENITVVKIPMDFVSSDTKVKNFALKYFFDNNEKGFVHLLEDSIDILKAPEEFMDALELMMKNLKLYSWFQTRKDECNYVLTKYNPKLKVQIDVPELQEKYDKMIYFTPFCNPLWAIYDYSIATYEQVKYDEEYTISMFYIIDYLARKKMRGEGFMNAYPSIEEENGVFDTKKLPSKDENQTKLQMQLEEIIFKKKHVDYKPDLDIDKILFWTLNTLKETLL